MAFVMYPRQRSELPAYCIGRSKVYLTDVQPGGV